MSSPLWNRLFRSARVLLAVIVWVGLACGGEETREEPRPGPEVRSSTQARIPPELRIAVEIDGKPVAPIDAAKLRRWPSGGQGVGRRVWDLKALLGPAYTRPGTVLEVEGAGGLVARYPRPEEGFWGQHPMLVLNRRGEVLVTLMHRSGTPPGFHGRGGGRGRGGVPRGPVRKVRVLRLFQGAEPKGVQGRPAVRPAASSEAVLGVFMDGERLATWTPEDLQAVPLASSGPRGQRQKRGVGRSGGSGPHPQPGAGPGQAWSLREIVGVLVGPDRIVESLQGERGRILELTLEDWNDSQKTPVLRLNRRGAFKFEWRGLEGQRTREGWLRGVNEIRLRAARP